MEPFRIKLLLGSHQGKQCCYQEFYLTKYQYQYFEKVEINIIENKNYYVTYKLIAYKEYEYATKFLNYGFDDIVCNLNVTRKEF